MTILVGVDRKFIPRHEAVKRLTHIADFLEKAFSWRLAALD